jgi:DNA-binding CsgD family transcriptional regulator
MRSPREDTRNPIAIAARLFDLTPTQVQVLSFLAQGHAPDAIADILGVGMATIRKHLKDLFARSGTSRQAELVARTLSLASPLRQVSDQRDAS